MRVYYMCVCAIRTDFSADGSAARTVKGKKYIVRRNADGSGRFCDNVSWELLMRADLRRKKVVGWDRDALKAGPPADGPIEYPLPNVDTDGRTVTVITDEADA